MAKAIQQFSDTRRNVVRGTVAGALTKSLGSTQINIIRDNARESDMLAAAMLLEAPGGLRGRELLNLKDGDVELIHRIEVRNSPLEASYACGVLNSWRDESRSAISVIGLLSQITLVPEKDALNALLAVARSWGSSHYLARKIAYAKEYFSQDAEAKSILAEIDNALDHKKHPSLQFYSLEILKSSISLFTVARRHINVLQKHAKDDFRRAISLNGFLATPVNEADCAGYILRSTETSLIDTAHSIWVVMNLQDRFPNVSRVIKKHLDIELMTSLVEAQQALSEESPPSLVAIPPLSADDDAIDNVSLLTYRRSATFLEFASICSFRNDVDQVIGYRLMAPLLPEITDWPSPEYSDKDTLRQQNRAFNIDLHDSSDVHVDTFYRTYLFLRFIQDPLNLILLDSADIHYIFETTMGLESLLLERELRTLHINASDEAKALISVLAMALYRAKSSDPDIDFDFRSRFEEYIQKNFSGKIVDFIDSIIAKSPGVAQYIVSSLDESTLQKMYSIVTSFTAAEEIRRDILTTVGIHLNRIEYIVEAEAIETRSKVAKLKEYFDTSRMFVDSIAMSKWLSSNPSAFTQQFKENLPRLAASFAESRNIVTPKGQETRLDFFRITTTDEYLVSEMAKEAFREFCISNEFGIESYLGRRIRHNTLQGVMTNSTDAVLQKPGHHPIIAGTPFGRALIGWESGYKIYIERMRKEFLQFKSDSKPNSLFNSEIDLDDPITKRNIQQLANNLQASGSEMLEELIISFCWRQIAPQLDAASRQIRVKMAQEVNQSLDSWLGRFDGPEELKIKADMAEAISSVFAKVAGWFQVPQTGFVPASIREICNIIDMDNGRPASSTIVSGSSLDTKYFGISVHRIYDCLAVLLQNAFKHGDASADVTVEVTSQPINGANLHVVDIAVRSTLPGDPKECIARVEAAVTSADTGKEMVTEGYSGIKKVKFITRLNEGTHTVRHSVDDSTIVVSFGLKAEVANQEARDENPSS